jgi:hypothetical protein
MWLGVCGSQQLLQIVRKELSATTVRKHKAVILKALRFKIVPCYLMKKWSHGFFGFLLFMVGHGTDHMAAPIA